MRVAWDARLLFRPRSRGIGNYGRGLLAGLDSLPQGPEVVLLHDTARIKEKFGRRAISLGAQWAYRFQAWERFNLPLGAALCKADLLHSIGNTTPPYSVVPRLVTVHDAIPFLTHLGEQGPSLAYFRKTVPEAIRTAAGIITDSEASAGDLLRLFGVNSAKMRVIPLAVPVDFQPLELHTRQEALLECGVASPFLLSLAAAAPRKNTVGVIRAFGRICRRFPNLALVLTGVDGELAATLAVAIRDFGIPTNRVILLGFVDSQTLAALYAGCTAFLFLSLYEGFGLPILEAMRCGAPVICSTHGSCSEVAGGAAILVDPRDEDAVVGTIGEVVGDSAGLAALAQAGHRREREFTWSKTAAATLEAYEQALR